jgi:uncharacterized membrane protein
MSLHITDYQNPLFVLGSLLIGVYLMIMINEDSKKTLINDIKNTNLVLFVIGLLAFSFYVFRTKSDSDKQKRLKEATRKALSAFIASYLVRINMMFAPFFIVFSLDYFLSGWV